jgi:hypothetical protein
MRPQATIWPKNLFVCINPEAVDGASDPFLILDESFSL